MSDIPSSTLSESPETNHTDSTNNLGSFSDQQNQISIPLLHEPYPPAPTKQKPSGAVVDELRRFRISLKWCLLDHSSATSRFLSYAAFSLLAVIVPSVATLSIRDNPVHFNKLVQIPLSGLAGAAFLALAPRGRVRVLDLDSQVGPELRCCHATVINRAFRRLALVFLPALLAELAHKLVFFSSFTVTGLHREVLPALNPVVFVLLVASWVYRTGVFMLACVMFRLTCELQILRFEGFKKMFDAAQAEGSETKSCEAMFSEHVRIRKQLGVTSHRYRLFIICSLFIITVSQFGALLLVLGSKTNKTFLNSGDLVVCSAVEISGLFMCLVGAARITHRAQRVVSVAARWHMLVTCASSSRSDQSKLDHVPIPESDHLISVPPLHVSSSFQTRQALVAYLQHNGGGITLFGFALDRGLLHTLFVFEFSLVLWILSKVVVLP